MKDSLHHLSNGTWAYLVQPSFSRKSALAKLIDVHPLAQRMQKWFQEQAEPVKAQCLVCGEVVETRSNFAKATGKGLCEKEACRATLTQAGIV